MCCVKSSTHQPSGPGLSVARGRDAGGWSGINLAQDGDIILWQMVFGKTSTKTRTGGWFTRIMNAICHTACQALKDGAEEELDKQIRSSSAKTIKKGGTWRPQSFPRLERGSNSPFHVRIASVGRHIPDSSVCCTQNTNPKFSRITSRTCSSVGLEYPLHTMIAGGRRFNPVHVQPFVFLRFQLAEGC